MSALFALGLGTGICCGIWGAISSIQSLGLVTWIGFAGCTAYFAMYISGLVPNVVAISFIMTGVISATMCWQAKAKELWFIPGAFIGCFTTFGAASMGINVMSGDIIHVILSFLCGGVLALSCDKSGQFLLKKFGKEEEN